MQRRTLLIAALSLPFATGAFAEGDEALYDAPPPADSAFVRIIDAAGKGGFVATIGEKSIDLSNQPVSGYAIVKAGTLAVDVAGKASEITLNAGKFYTVALNFSDAPVVIEDAAIASPAKAGLYFYNLSQTPEATLFAPKQNVAVIDKVAAGKGGFREINAVTLDLDVKAGDASAGSLKDIALKRRSGMTIVLFASGTVAHAANAVLP